MVFSKDATEHGVHLRQVLEKLRAAKLYAKLSKYSFYQDSVKYLGHVVSGNGMRVDPTKIKGIVEWLSPRYESQMRSLLGLGNYFKRVQGYSKLVEPLVRLTNSSVKFNFQENAEAQRAFGDLIRSLSHAPVLALPDFSQPYEVVCDASGFGCGAVLLQGEKPLAFHTYKFNRHEQNAHPGG